MVITFTIINVTAAFFGDYENGLLICSSHNFPVKCFYWFSEFIITVIIVQTKHW